MRYSNINKEKVNGVVYTPKIMAEYLAKEMINYKNRGKENKLIKILDPAIGKGELICALLGMIDTEKHDVEVVGYETDANICEEIQRTLTEKFPMVKFFIKNEDFLEAVKNKKEGKFDYVIANPPYIRTQIIGSRKAQEISSSLGLKGKIDLYYAFIISTKEVLKEDGIAGYITSNKILSIKSGKSVRDYIIENYKVHQITDLGDTKLFSASVLPCIMIFSNGKTNDKKEVSFSSVYEANVEDFEGIIDNIFDAIGRNGNYKSTDGKIYRYQQGNLQSVDKGAIWNVENNDIQEWLQMVERNTWKKFADIGKVRVGIKTTADNVFIKAKWEGDNADLELLKPLITHRNAGQILPNMEKLWKVLYTHTTQNGIKKVVNLEEYPKSKKYLLQYYEQLASRKYVIKAKRNWYEIWVPQDPKLWNQRKIVFRDIAEHPQFWLDTSGAIVNGDCYWIEIQEHVTEDVIYLALAIANSRFIEKYYDMKFNTKLYSRKRRFMSQYVEEFPIPDYSSELSQKAIELVRKIIAEKDEEVILKYKEDLNRVVDNIFV